MDQSGRTAILNNVEAYNPHVALLWSFSLIKFLLSIWDFFAYVFHIFC